MPIKSLILFFLILITKSLGAQSLLVNGSFEEENICTEYQVNCAPEGWISTIDGFNNYFKDARGSYHGIHCMSIEAGRTRNKFKRTYIRSQLLCGLRKGNKYRLEFFVRSRHDILDSIGVLFTSYDFLFEKTPGQKIKPSILLKEGNKFTKGDSTWKKVTLDYTANGTEKFITIGNFSTRDINGETGIPYESRFFVFIDYISLNPLNRSEKLCPGWTTSREKIYKQNERHEFLQRYVMYYRNNNKLPDPPALIPTFQPYIDTLVVPDVLFAFDRKDLQRTSYKVLDSFCTMIRGRKIDSIIVEGHTDSTGMNLYNWQLSIERAGTVANFLSGNCKLKSEIHTRAWASEKPVADNRTPAGRQRNRRVEILLYIRQ